MTRWPESWARSSRWWTSCTPTRVGRNGRKKGKSEDEGKRGRVRPLVTVPVVAGTDPRRLTLPSPLFPALVELHLWRFPFLGCRNLEVLARRFAYGLGGEHLRELANVGVVVLHRLVVVLARGGNPVLGALELIL